jgi:hypothetical protein
MTRIETTPRDAVYNLLEAYRSSIISQGKNTAEQRAKLIATDHPILVFAARILEVYADVDDWVAWAERRAAPAPVSLPTGQSISGAGLEDTQEG